LPGILIFFEAMVLVQPESRFFGILAGADTVFPGKINGNSRVWILVRVSNL